MIASTKETSLLAQASFSFRCPEYAIYQLEYRYLRALAGKKKKAKSLRSESVKTSSGVIEQIDM